MGSRNRWLALAVVLPACASGGGARGPDAKERCRARLEPRAPEASDAGVEVAPPPPPEAAPTRLVVRADLRLAALTGELERGVPARVAEARDEDIGFAGSLRYTVDRGPFRASVEDGALVVRTDLRAHAEACAKGRCYASCDPTAVATARVSLWLEPTYRFAPSRVDVAFTRGCAVRALGGFVTIDVTPMLRASVTPALRAVERDVDGRLPALRPEAERLFRELGTARPLPFGACVVVDPRGIVQGPASGTPDGVRLRFALLARPEIRARCGTPPPPAPLPPLGRDPAMPEDDDVNVALVSPLAAAAAALDASAFDAGGPRVKVDRAELAPAPGGVRADLALDGEVCGDVAVRSRLGWTDDRRAVRLVDPALSPREADRVQHASVDPAALCRGVAASARLAPAVAPDALAELLPELARSASDASFDVAAEIRGVAPGTVDVRGDDMVARVRLRGAVVLRQK